MGEIIKIENEGNARYEELLLRRDKLKKEAHILQGEYIREFGDLITSVFRKKIDCIQKKKTIGYCQAAINRGTTIDAAAMQAQIQKEMEVYQMQLKQMVDENEAAHQITTIPAGEVAKIKRLYHKLAKILHPDINPKTNEIPELLSLWHMVVVSYQSNSLDDLQEAEILIGRALKEHHISNLIIEIPNLNEKIAKVEEEIYQIKGSNPYQYKYLLSDKELVEERKKSLQAELKEYEDYEKELDTVMTQLMGSGVSFTWQMS